MSDPTYLTAIAALAGYRSGALSPVEVTRAALDRIAALNGTYNAFCVVDEERALAEGRVGLDIQLAGPTMMDAAFFTYTERDFVVVFPLMLVVIILVMMAILLVLGMFLDWIGVAMLALPIFVPIVVQLGYSPIWFGILFAVNMQVSFLSPPFGPAAFYLKGVAPPSISLKDIFVSLLPFIAIQLCVLFLLLFFPDLAMWLV